MILDGLKSFFTKTIGKAVGILVALLGGAGIIIPDDLSAQLTTVLVAIVAVILAWLGDLIVSKIPWFDNLLGGSADQPTG